MKSQIDCEDAAEAVLTAEEPDVDFDAWTLDDLTDLGSVRWESAESDDAG